MRIMIVGSGAVGTHLSQKFSEDGLEVVLVDTNEKKLQRLERELNILTVKGSGASARALEEAGIDRTDLFIAVTDSDEVNLVSCILSKNYNVKTRIARVRNEDFYSQNTALDEKKMGIDMLISPDKAISDEIIHLSALSEAFEAVEFAEGEVVVLGYTIQEGNPIVGKSLMDLKGGIGVVAAIVRAEHTIIPRGNDKIEAGDRIYVVGKKNDIGVIEEAIHSTSRAAREVFIIGGGNIGYMVARQMERSKIHVKIVEKDPERCRFLAENLEKTVVLNFDGFEAHDLLDEGIDQADLVISATDSDTTNILSSLLAKHHGAKKCITRISRPDFIPLLGKLGIDVALSPRLVAANMILKFVRQSDAIVSATVLLGSDAEVVELRVPDLENLTKIPLQALDFPRGAVLGAVVRKKGKVIIPTGTTRLRAGDKLVIFATRDAIKSVELFFAEN